MHALCFVYSVLYTLYFVLYSNPVCFIHDDLNPEIIREQGTVRSTLSCHQPSNTVVENRWSMERRQP